MGDISFVVFTNENYFDLLYLTLPYTIENTKHLNKTINVVSNKIPKHEVFYGINYIDSNVEFSSDGSHFRDTLLFALKKKCFKNSSKSPITKIKGTTWYRLYASRARRRIF